MAANSPVQLWEHLQEQQKPFVLEHYLAERKVMNKNPKKSACSRSYEMNKKRILKYAKILKFLLHKFIRTGHRQIERPQQSGGRKWFSQVSKSVPCQYGSSKQGAKVSSLASSQHLKHSSFREQKVAVKTNLQRRSREDNKQLCPVTALHEAPSSNKVYQFLQKQVVCASTSSSNILTQNVDEGSVFSTFLWKLTVKSLIERLSHVGLKELGEMIGPAGFSMQLKNRVFLEQNSQFLSDCVTGKSIEPRQRRKYQKLMGLQELGKRSMDKQNYSWGKENAVMQMKLDGSNTLEDWDYLQQPNRIGVEMGDILMDEIIQEVVDFLYLYCKPLFLVS